MWYQPPNRFVCYYYINLVIKYKLICFCFLPSNWRIHLPVYKSKVFFIMSQITLSKLFCWYFIHQIYNCNKISSLLQRNRYLNALFPLQLICDSKPFNVLCCKLTICYYNWQIMLFSNFWSYSHTHSIYYMGIVGMNFENMTTALRRVWKIIRISFCLCLTYLTPFVFVLFRQNILWI